MTLCRLIIFILLLMKIDDVLNKTGSGELLSRDEMVFLLDFPSDSIGTYMVMAEANRISKEVSQEKLKFMPSSPSILRRAVAIVCFVRLRK